MKKNKLGVTLLTLSSILLMAGCSSDSKQFVKKVARESGVTQKVKEKAKEKVNEFTEKKKTEDTDKKQADSVTSTDFKATYDELSKKDFITRNGIVLEVNGGKSTLNPKDFKGPKVEYSDLDELNRTGAATAYLTKDNLGKSAGREGQTWNPTGWHNQAKKVAGKRVYPQNRGHLIAYTVTFNLDDDGNFKKGEDGSLDNPKNLFTQSTYSNQITFQKYEGMVRDALAKGHKVIYRVEPVFRGDEKMARGAWTQAISDDGSLNFNAYVYNVQPGITYNYADGTSKVDNSMIIND